MWQKLLVLIAVVEQNGFAKAAKKLGLSKATVTRYIQELETEYQSKLFTRTTRHIGLTEQGNLFYQHALELTQLNSNLRAQLEKKQNTISGHIKIGLPASILHSFINGKIGALLKKFPELSIEIIQGNHLQDILSSHFDLIIHCGPLPNVNLLYEKIADWQKITCASPAYLKKQGKPEHPTELTQHNCLDHADNHTSCWEFMIKNKLATISVKGNIAVDSSLALQDLALKDLGIVHLPSFTLNNALSTKKLIPILEHYSLPSLPIYALYTQRRQVNHKVNIIVEYLKSNYIPII